MKNNVAGHQNTKRAAEAKLLLWESRHWMPGAETRARREAKRMFHRAIRRSARAAIREQEET